jgi:hypothetical protein
LVTARDGATAANARMTAVANAIVALRMNLILRWNLPTTRRRMER